MVDGGWLALSEAVGVGVACRRHSVDGGCIFLGWEGSRQPLSIARPLPKFFNLSEYQGTIPDGVPNIYEKLDGSLIILFHYQGEWEVASRGSFASEQAQMARVLLANYQADLGTIDREYTYLFEIIYPSNRIVVDYGSSRRLVLLAAVHTQTGVELEHPQLNWSDIAQTYPATTLPEWL